MAMHGSSGTFFPFKSQSPPQAITYNIITSRRPQSDPAYSFDINRNRIAQLAPFYYRSAHVPAAIRLQLTGASQYTSGGLVALPFDGNPFAYGFGGLTQNVVRGVPYPVLFAGAAPAPFLF